MAIHVAQPLLPEAAPFRAHATLCRIWRALAQALLPCYLDLPVTRAVDHTPPPPPLPGPFPWSHSVAQAGLRVTAVLLPPFLNAEMKAASQHALCAFFVKHSLPGALS